MKDWIGNKNSIYTTLGASNHTKEDRAAHDYYATEPKAAEMLLDLENFNNILEPACGEGHLSRVFDRAGLKVTSSDLIDRSYGQQKDFFTYEKWDGDIITNPPYKYALDFVKHALRIIPEGNKVAMFLKLQFLESKGRKEFFIQQPPKTLYVSSSRIICAKNADFANVTGSAVAYAWYVWQKGNRKNTKIIWFN